METKRQEEMRQSYLFVVAESYGEFLIWRGSQSLLSRGDLKKIAYMGRTDRVCGLKRGFLFVVLQGFSERGDFDRFETMLTAKMAHRVHPKEDDTEAAHRYLKMMADRDV